VRFIPTRWFLGNSRNPPDGSDFLARCLVSGACATGPTLFSDGRQHLLHIHFWMLLATISDVPGWPSDRPFRYGRDCKSTEICLGSNLWPFIDSDRCILHFATTCPMSFIHDRSWASLAGLPSKTRFLPYLLSLAWLFSVGLRNRICAKLDDWRRPLGDSVGQFFSVVPWSLILSQ